MIIDIRMGHSKSYQLVKDQLIRQNLTSRRQALRSLILQDECELLIETGDLKHLSLIGQLLDEEQVCSLMQ